MMLPALIALSATLTAPVPLGTHETFGGTVNDTRTGATIRMACFGPDRPGRLGHPMAGQSVGVFIPEVLADPSFGRTGDPARAIVVSLRRRGAGRSAAEAAPCRGGRAQLLLGAGLGAPPPPASSASLSFGRPGPPWSGCTPLTWSVTRWTRWACSASACAGVIAPLFTASASS